MKKWILKTEPHDYSFEQLAIDKNTMWDGVRNYQARNNLKTMQAGDLALIYHSVGPKSLVGVAEITGEAIPETMTERGEWFMVPLKYRKKLNRPVTLNEIKDEPRLSGLGLVKQGRLSVSPVSDKEWSLLFEMAQTME